METTTQKQIFKTEWSDSDFKLVKKRVLSFLQSRHNKSAKFPQGIPLSGTSNFKQFADFFGFAYTSSSSYAMYCLCNDELFLDVNQLYKIEFFGMDMGGFVYAICWDKDENELVINIG
jgi:hypothetical protein